MLAHRLRRWPSIKTTMGQPLVFAGKGLNDHHSQNKTSYTVIYCVTVYKYSVLKTGDCFLC